MPEDPLQKFLLRLIRREDLKRDEATQLLETLLSGKCSDVQIAATLVALATKGETIDELAGMAIAMRSSAVQINSSHDCFVDTAGTGSSPAKTFNVSTVAAIVAAGAGLPVAKHGNRAASSRSGSADVLTALGVNINAEPQISERCLNEIGICFMFAPLYHGATARVAGVRRELGIYTTFNLLGPLSNPARAPRQVIGVWRSELVERLAQVLAAMGSERAWVVHGHDGLDEITIGAKTDIAEVNNGKVRLFEVEPGDFGLWSGSLEHLKGGDAKANAGIIREVLSGERRDEARALVVVNAAAALCVGGFADDLLSAAALAENSIDSGAAQRKLERLIRMTAT